MSDLLSPWHVGNPNPGGTLGYLARRSSGAPAQPPLPTGALPGNMMGGQPAMNDQASGPLPMVSGPLTGGPGPHLLSPVQAYQRKASYGMGPPPNPYAPNQGGGMPPAGSASPVGQAAATSAVGQGVDPFEQQLREKAQNTARPRIFHGEAIGGGFGGWDIREANQHQSNLNAFLGNRQGQEEHQGKQQLMMANADKATADAAESRASLEALRDPNQVRILAGVKTNNPGMINEGIASLTPGQPGQVNPQSYANMAQQYPELSGMLKPGQEVQPSTVEEAFGNFMKLHPKEMSDPNSQFAQHARYAIHQRMQGQSYAPPPRLGEGSPLQEMMGGWKIALNTLTGGGLGQTYQDRLAKDDLAHKLAAWLASGGQSSPNPMTASY